MTLKSALQDVRETTLAGISGLLGKLSYLASLRRGRGRYQHWGMEFVHGVDASERALRTAHLEVMSGVLRAPLATLEQDLQHSSAGQGLSPAVYVEEMREGASDLLPDGRQSSVEAIHLSSVLAALSSLEKSRARATRSVS